MLSWSTPTAKEKGLGASFAVKETLWTDLIAVGGHVFFAPGGDGEPVIMDPKFSQFWKFTEETSSSIIPREGVRWCFYVLLVDETSIPSVAQQMPKQGVRKQGRTQRAVQRVSRAPQRAPARQRMTKRPGKAKKSKKNMFGNGGELKEASKRTRNPIEKVRRTIVSLGNKLILSPGLDMGEDHDRRQEAKPSGSEALFGDSKHLLIVNLLSGINTTVEEDNEVLSVRQRLDKQHEED
eukprot:s2655_g1.t1